MLEYIISGIISMAVAMFTMYKISKKKIDFNNHKIYLYYTIGTALCILFSIYTDNIIRSFVMTFYYTFILYVLGRKFKQALLGAISFFFLIIISELIVTGILTLFFSIDFVDIQNNEVSYILVNVLVSIFIVLLMSFNQMKKLFYLCQDLIKNIKAKLIVIAILSILLLFFVYQISMYYGFSDNLMFYIDILFVITYTIVILMALREKNKSMKFQGENEYLYSNLSAYEKMLDNQRMSNHENKNQLLIIKEMILNKDKDALNYIDEVIKDNKKDSIPLLDKTKKIPSGGLQAIISQKIVEMHDKEIKCLLYISKDIKVNSLMKLSVKDSYDLCRIMGVFLDNAIEAVSKLEEKEISVSLYKEDEIIIEISNVCHTIPKIDELGISKNSSKGECRGNGLLLVNKIVNESSVFENVKEVTDNVFTQILKIEV